GFAPGEWTDDTAQAYSTAEVAATGADLRSDEALTSIARRLADWYADGPSDVGIQTRAVLSAVGRRPSTEEMRQAARLVHDRTGRSAGNGSLMRTSAVALAHLDDPEALVEAAAGRARLAGCRATRCHPGARGAVRRRAVRRTPCAPGQFAQQGLHDALEALEGK
ncbi:MAG TPA: ADP-ribosylglycohydrolase family protein, partial [Kribbella sp.]|nr:ADP-ribosylglycohydrolase family protein [Kribbella sp.]